MDVESTISRRDHRRFYLYIFLSAALVSISLVGCDGQASRAKEGKKGGVIYFGIEVPFQGFDLLKTGVLNPLLAALNNLIMEPLLRKDRSGNLIPALGLSATPSADGKGRGGGDMTLG
jgi:hypothetical protein